MRLAIGDQDGNLLGIVDAEGIAWKFRGDHLVNADEISVYVSYRGGLATYFSLLDSLDNILQFNGPLDRAYNVGLGDTLMFRPGTMRVSWIVDAHSALKLTPLRECLSGGHHDDA
jgi:hypothetical protein